MSIAPEQDKLTEPTISIGGRKITIIYRRNGEINKLIYRTDEEDEPINEQNRQLANAKYKEINEEYKKSALFYIKYRQKRKYEREKITAQNRTIRNMRDLLMI